MSLKEKELYEFGQFRLDVAEHFLVRSESGERVALSEKAFETLCVLVRNAGHLVQKDELMRQVWADSFVEENNLNKCIHAVRRALGEKPGEQQFIETVKKHGFRFVAEVRRLSLEETTGAVDGKNGFQSKINRRPSAKVLGLSEQTKTQKPGVVVALADWRHEAAQNTEVEADEIAPSAILVESTVGTTEPELIHAAADRWRTPKFRLPLAVFALAAALMGLSALGFYFYGSKNAPPANDRKSIAVMPIKPINAGVRDELYEIGIADSLIHRLSSMKGFIVRPLSATRKYADLEQDAIAAGKEQQVDYVLASNYQLADGKIRITAQLFNVAGGQIEETYKSEKDLSDIFAMQDAIASEVGNALLARFATTSSKPAAKRGTHNEEAYRLYLQGMYLYSNNPADSQKAVKVFEQAVGLDPNYADAWAGKAHAHRMIANLGRGVNIHEENQKSNEAVDKALMLDADSADAQSALCENKMYYDYDFAGAERACRRAIELDPNSSRSHEVYSRYLSGRGRHAEAIAEVKTAIELEPASLFNQLLYANSLHFARRYEEAAAQYRRVITMDENSILAYPLGSNTLALLGNEPEAFEWWIKYQTLIKAGEETVRDYKTAYQTSGWQGVQRERVKRFDASNLVYFHGAAFNAQIGNTDKAFEYLEKSYQRREYWMSYLLIDPRLDSLHDDPRFDEWVRRVGLK